MSKAKDQMIAAQRKQTKKIMDILNDYDRIEQQRDKLLTYVKYLDDITLYQYCSKYGAHEARRMAKELIAECEDG